ncbi:MAG: hypothetical protein QHI38_04425 [Armatimonadota bacterium]|nr:hypothetical protein [Armatimonadota bacterium]
MNNKIKLTLALLLTAVVGCSPCLANSFGITVSKEVREGMEQLVFDSVAENVRYVLGSYKYTKVNGVWSTAHEPASPGLGYGDIHRKFDAMALFFRPEAENARFLIVTGMPWTGTGAANLGYGNRMFGPGDLKIDVGSDTYGVGLRLGGLFWGTVDPGPSQPWFQIHKAEGGTDAINARDAGTIGSIEKNPQWDHVDNHTLPPYSENAYAFFRAGSGTRMPGNAQVSFWDTGVTLQGFAVYAYEVAVPWSSLEMQPNRFAFRASWRPDCGNDLILGSFENTCELPAPPIPEASALWLAPLGLTVVGRLRKRLGAG